MTRKDFKIITEIISKLPLDKSNKAIVMCDFAEELKKTNPLFDNNKFFTDCKQGDK